MRDAIFSGGQLSFDDLLLRIHPAESRIRKLSAATPATLMCFDLLVNDDGQIADPLLLVERRQKLEEFFSKVPPKGMVRLSPATKERSQAEQWMRQMGAIGLDGIIAKRLDEPYRSGERTAMVKIKTHSHCRLCSGRLPLAERVANRFALAGSIQPARAAGSRGFTSSFNAEQRRELKKSSSRWLVRPASPDTRPRTQSLEHQALHEGNRSRPSWFAKVQYDHFSGGRFRHGTNSCAGVPKRNLDSVRLSR